ncbi:DUF1648 domain-containing protein [Evansella sp. AB-P1]|uniref:DUF1648 domain-containing protein n=1 Tax=Evansella sp. AB-P1 TaxID=3037653 RepID=UPI00241E2460|nr:DUF1648 domain-containing protein [Evansella sp. AB-P1]MDG5788573.1 DUF1648 domain-containing protein [Evansella sp. AB-P1]
MGMFNSNRPKIPLEKLQKSTMVRFLDITSILVFVGSVIFVVIMWSNVPDQVPAHFGFSGEVTRFGSKWELMIIPVVGLFLYLLLQFLESKPHLHNYPIKITETNAEDAYRISRSMVVVMKNIILIMFTVMMINSMIIAMEWGEGIGFVLLPLILLGTGVPIVIALIKLAMLKS